MNNLTKKHLPAEWSEQDAILICWPHESMDWQAILPEVEPAFEQFAFYICQSQSLIIIAHDEKHQQHIEQALINNKTRLSSVKWLLHPNNDTWCRDFGPLTIFHNNKPIALDFSFNGWGEKYAYTFDNSTNQALKRNNLIKCPLQTHSLILEGGSIDSDGAGTLLTTEHCLLADKRNTELSKQQIEDTLSELLGCERLIWIKNGYLEGDDTDSHIDNLARFCNAETIAYASCKNQDDIHYQSLNAMEAELKQLKTMNGNPYKLIDLSIPDAIYNDGDRLPASYVNFLITNEYVLMPTYNDEQDMINLNKLQNVFTDRKVVGIDCSSVIKQSGSIHCLTMQLPRHTVF